MTRAVIRIGIVGLGVAAVGASALFCAAGAKMRDEPQQRVGVHLEFPGDRNGADETLIAGVRRSLPRLLASTQARRVKVRDIDASTLEVTFTPAQEWSVQNGLIAEGSETAPELVPESLRTLLTAPCDLRLLEVVDVTAGAEVERDRTARDLEGHPERALGSLQAALRSAAERGHVVAWCPRAGGELVPVLVEGERDRQITILDLDSASRGTGPADVELHFDEARRLDLEQYVRDLAGKRLAVLVDGAIVAIGEAHAFRANRLALDGDGEEMTAEDCAAILSRVRQPLLPLQPRITRSWITPTSGLQSGGYMILIGVACALFAAAMVWVFARELRHVPEAPRELDWSSGA
jgi:hypothetical protein